MTRGRPLPDGLAALHLDRYAVARIRRHAAALARDLPPGTVARIDSAGLQVEQPSPAVLAVMDGRVLHEDAELRVAILAGGTVLVSRESPTSYRASAWLLGAEAVDSSRRTTRDEAEAAVLARMGR